MSQNSSQIWGLASVVCLLTNLFVPASANAQVPLTRADVEAIQNRVDFLPDSGTVRRARLSDWLSLGDAVRTASTSRVDLRFNDGSLARVGERATFWFIPNTRNFRLSNGTALFLIPPDRGPSVIETPNAVTGIQGTALIVRYVPEGDRSTDHQPSQPLETDAGRTVVMVLTNNPAGPVEVRLRDGRTADLMAGQMAIVDNGNLYLFEFDLALFYETSPLVEGLYLNDPDYPSEGQPTDDVRQQTWQGLAEQPNFVGDYLLNPTFLSPNRNTDPAQGWLFPANTQPAQPTSTPPSTSPPVDDTPTSPPHDSSADEIDLVPPAPDTLPNEALPSSDHVDDAPGPIPPGLIAPSPSESNPPPPISDEPPAELLPTPELSPPDEGIPEFEENLPGRDDNLNEG